MQTMRHEMGLELDYLVALYPLTESIGRRVRESVTGQYVNLTDSQDWVTLPTRPIICNGDTKYSPLGLCQGKSLFVK